MTKFNKKANEDAIDDSPNPFEVDGDPDIIAVLDGDEIAFKVAAAAEERGIKVVNTSIPDEEGQGIWKNRTLFHKFMNGIQYPEDKFTIEDTQIAEPIQNAISTVKARIASLCKKCDAGSFEIYLSGKDNFRDFLPLPLKYKDSRADKVKPLLLKELKQYLIEYKGAVVIDDMEADDMLTIRMSDGYRTEKKIVGVTQDKDATQCQGWYLHPDKSSEPFFIDGYGKIWMDNKNVKKETVRGYGNIFLYFQLLIGDKVDYYNPRDLVKEVTGKKPRYGEKTCFEQLVKFKNDKEALTYVVEMYKKWFGEEEFTFTDCHGEEQKNCTWLNALQWYGDCAYMLRSEDDMFDAVKLLKKYKVDY